MNTYIVQYFGCPHVINDSFHCGSSEEAAFRFNKKYFGNRYPATFENFKLMSEHLKYWGLVIDNENYHDEALAQHKEQMKEAFKKFISLCKNKD